MNVVTLEVGDLVACYVTNTSEYESLMCWGVVIDINKTVGDVLVIDNAGSTNWWPARRWRIISKKSNNSLDLKDKIL